MPLPSEPSHWMPWPGCQTKASERPELFPAPATAPELLIAAPVLFALFIPMSLKPVERFQMETSLEVVVPELANAWLELLSAVVEFPLAFVALISLNETCPKQKTESDKAIDAAIAIF